jgi:aminoglycoside phosphotransferase (APT) family kinase protein
MNVDEAAVPITSGLVAELIRQQFPAWSDRPITRVEPGGWDHRTFRLGADLLVRLPSHARYAPQVDKEQRWLPVLARALPLPIPTPIARGAPSREYPWPWSIYRWLDGAPACRGNADMPALARDLGCFLRALHRADSTGGPPAGEHNFFRGGPVATYDGEVRDALAALRERVDTRAVASAWQTALASSWPRPGVWVHGDVTPGNLLVRARRLAAVIDFGSCGVGDPACDLTVAWTLLRGSERGIFRSAVELDDDTWARARGWALWKALILLRAASGSEAQSAQRVLHEVLADAGT